MARTPVINGATLKNNEIDISVLIDGKRYTIEEPVDVIEIDGNLYFVYKKFYTYGPKPAGDISIAKDIRPSLRLISLASGVFVPTDYLNSKTIDGLKRLDEEYLSYLFVYKLNCEGAIGNDCIDLHGKLLEIEKAQARLVVGALKEKGFSFSMKMPTEDPDYIVVEVKGPDKTVGYFQTLNVYNTLVHSRAFDDCYVGKWSVLGPVFYSFTKPDIGHAFGTVKLPKADYVTTLDAVLSKEADYFRTLGSNERIYPVIPIRGTRHKLYEVVVRYVAGIPFALDYTPLHLILTKADIGNASGGKTVLRSTRYCVECNRTIATLWGQIPDALTTR